MVIRQLSPEQSARIAAGEVVERPASAVKELIENALDADATKVTVEIEGGGCSLIRVADNGHGIAQDEVAKAFLRFATSKIDDSSDLQSITTLGFRGEALPSIAAVAEVEIVTNSGDGGMKCTVKYGSEPQVEPHHAAPGTVVTVKNLFFNTPARLKFLSSTRSETNRVRQTVALLAGANPDIAFEFIVESKRRMLTLGTGDHGAFVDALLGTSVAAEMLPVTITDIGGTANFNIKGAVSPPHIKRTTRANIYFSVNGRPVTNRTLFAAALAAYRPFLKDHEYPIIVLNLAIPFEDVDVNVHPAKLEVRLRNERTIYDIMLKAISAALTGAHHKEAVFDGGEGGMRHNGSLTNGTAPGRHGGALGETQVGWAPNLPHHKLQQIPLADEQSGDTAFAAANVLGQTHLTYIVADDDSGIYLFDQHAAHERVVYERIKKDMEDGVNSNQPLLEPLALEVPTATADLCGEQSENLTLLGFEAEVFGKGQLLLRAVPTILFKNTANPVDQTFLTVLEGMEQESAKTAWHDNALKTLACHSSYRAGMRLTVAEARTLLKDLAATPNHRTCPHGRPTVTKLSIDSIGHLFGR